MAVEVGSPPRHQVAYVCRARQRAGQLRLEQEEHVIARFNAIGVREAPTGLEDGVAGQRLRHIGQQMLMAFVQRVGATSQSQPMVELGELRSAEAAAQRRLVLRTCFPGPWRTG